MLSIIGHKKDLVPDYLFDGNTVRKIIGKRAKIITNGEHKGKEGVVAWAEPIGDEWQCEILLGIHLDEDDQVQYYEDQVKVY
jgi:hypothetical protein